MKKAVLWVVVVVVMMSFSRIGFAQADIGFKGVGARLGYVMPEDPIENTLGFGAQAELGTIMPNLALSAILDYWKKSYDVGTNSDYGYSEFVIGALAKYYFKMNSAVKPYAGGGLGLVIGSSSWDYTNIFTGEKVSESESDTDIGIFIQGGAEYPISPNFTGFAELKYHLGGIDYFGIFIGFNYMLGQ